MNKIVNFIENKIWIIEYPIKYSGVKFSSRTTLIKLSDQSILIHSPCNISAELKDEILKLGDVSYIIAPGNFHHLHIKSAQQAFPKAKTYICQGIEKKQPDLKYDGFLSGNPICNDFEQQMTVGSKIMNEVAFLHKDTKTLILVDLIENIGNKTKNIGLGIKLWWFIFRMWNKPKPAPEYQLGWQDKKLAAQALQKILSWDFEKIILAHGDLIVENAKEIAKTAWKKPLNKLN